MRAIALVGMAMMALVGCSADAGAPSSVGPSATEALAADAGGDAVTPAWPPADHGRCVPPDSPAGLCWEVQANDGNPCFSTPVPGGLICCCL